MSAKYDWLISVAKGGRGGSCQPLAALLWGRHYGL